MIQSPMTQWLNSSTNRGAHRIGILGGTFNPIHLGHLHIAERAQKLFDLSRVLFVVSTTPPHKKSQHQAHFVHRYAMVSLATAESQLFEPSMVELSPPASPFSVDTLTKLSRAEGRTRELYFIAGTDSMLEIAAWRRSEKLLACCNFIFVSRPGVDLTGPETGLPPAARLLVRDLRGIGPRRLRLRIQSEAAAGEKRMYVVDLKAPDISAARIRNLAASGRRVQSLVPRLVYQYMQKFHLYGDR